MAPFSCLRWVYIPMNSFTCGFSVLNLCQNQRRRKQKSITFLKYINSNCIGQQETVIFGRVLVLCKGLRAPYTILLRPSFYLSIRPHEAKSIKPNTQLSQRSSLGSVCGLMHVVTACFCESNYSTSA